MSTSSTDKAVVPRFPSGREKSLPSWSVRKQGAWGRALASPQVVIIWGLIAHSSRFDAGHPTRASITRCALGVGQPNMRRHLPALDEQQYRR
jgi:hypothetical protein